MFLQEAFVVQKQLLIKIKTTQKPDPAGLAELLKPLNKVISKANAMTEGKRSEFFNHLKASVDSLSALAWIAFTEKGCGMSMPIAHIEESWQMAEFYSNKVLFMHARSLAIWSSPFILRGKDKGVHLSEIGCSLIILMTMALFFPLNTCMFIDL